MFVYCSDRNIYKCKNIYISMAIFGKSDMGYIVIKYLEIFGMKVKVDPELRKEWELRYD